MKIVKPSFTIELDLSGEEILKAIERFARTSYQTEVVTDTSAPAFVRARIKDRHYPVLERCGATVRFICSRGMSHEIVRHRLASYCQESTRYCNYSKDKFENSITLAPYLEGLTIKQIARRQELWELSEKTYLAEIKEKVKPQQARDNLLICLKTELTMTANMVSWRHFFSLRTPITAHPQLRQVTCPLLAEFRRLIPVVFDDVGIDNGEIMAEMNRKIDESRNRPV